MTSRKAGCFALYRYTANRKAVALSPNGENSAAEEEEDGGASLDTSTASSGGVAEFLDQEARADYSFSLEVVRTDLTTPLLEHELRQAIFAHLNKGTLYARSGDVFAAPNRLGTALGLSLGSSNTTNIATDTATASGAAATTTTSTAATTSSATNVSDENVTIWIYYRLLRDISGDVPAVGTDNAVVSHDHLAVFARALPNSDAGNARGAGAGARSIVGGDGGLDLFRSELDWLCQRLQDDGKLPMAQSCSSTERGDSTGANTSGAVEVKPHDADSQRPQCLESGHLDDTLASWYTISVEYLPRVVNRFGEDLSLLIHAALTGRALEVTGGTPAARADVRLFLRTLTETPLLRQVAGVATTSSTMIGDNEPKVRVGSPFAPPAPGARFRSALSTPPHTVVTLAPDDNGFSFSSMLDATDFCRSWARSLILAASVPAAAKVPIAMKQVVHDHEMQLIQEVNAMKRFVHAARTSMYALHAALQYLATCRTVPYVVMASVLASASSESNNGGGGDGGSRRDLNPGPLASDGGGGVCSSGSSGSACGKVSVMDTSMLDVLDALLSHIQLTRPELAQMLRFAAAIDSDVAMNEPATCKAYPAGAATATADINSAAESRA